MSGFDISGNYSRSQNFQADRDAAIKIRADHVDNEFDTAATGFNLTFLRDGRVPMSGEMKLGNNQVSGVKGGTAALPSVTWNGDVTTGLYQPIAGAIGISTGGVSRLTIGADGYVNALTGLTSPSDISSKVAGRAYVAMMPSTGAGVSGFFGTYNSAGTRIGYKGYWDGTLYYGAWTDGTTPVVFGFNGTEKIRFDANGVIVMGNSSAGAWLPNATFGMQIQGAKRVAIAANSEQFGIYLQYNTVTAGAYLGSPSANTLAAYDSAGTQIFSANSGGLSTTSLVTSAITSSGVMSFSNAANGFIQGYNGASTRLHYAGYNNSTNIQYMVDGGSGLGLALGTAGVDRIIMGSAGLIGFNAQPGGWAGNNATESRQLATGQNCFSGYAQYATGSCFLGRVDSTSANLAGWYYQGSQVGTITTNSASTAYNTSSDYRLKMNVQTLTGGLDSVLRLRPVIFDWVHTDEVEQTQGFIAHEVGEVYAQAVHGTKDAVDGDGNPAYQALDHSKLVPMLVAAIQELKAEFDAYKALHP